MDFIALGLSEILSDTLKKAGIAEPTDVQNQALPPLLAGKDGVIISPTGTGKTLAYLLPILQKIDPARRETQALVLAPTQELAMQIVREAELYGAPLGIKATALIGGASIARQLERMKSKPALIVGTPGRVREVATTRKLSLHTVNNVVVDETDRIFSLGGRSDVENLMRQCSRERQTVFASATRSESMRDAEQKWLKEPWVSDVTKDNNENGLSSTLEHWYFLTERREKIDLIRKLVRHMKPSTALLFVNDTNIIGELLAKLKYEGLSVAALYGDTRGQERGDVMQRFRNGRTSILIATDVAARGLDLPGLPLVIQFEPALDADHYVHRSGRTARMGREGISITLVTHQERFIIDKLEKQLKIQVSPKMLFGGKVVSLEEGIEGNSSNPTSSSKPQSSKGETRDRPVLKSKAEYLATLKPELKQQLVVKQPGTASSGATTPKPHTPTRATADSSVPKKAYSASRATADSSVPKKAHNASRVTDSVPAPKEHAPSKATGAAPAARVNSAASTKVIKPGKVKNDRHRDQKNKGAPKWLKDKRETPPSE